MILGALWKYISAGLLFLLILTAVAFQMEKRHSAKLQAQVVKLERIASERNEQRTVTRDRIKIATRNNRTADDKAKQVEQSQPVANCKTPPIVMGADL